MSMMLLMICCLSVGYMLMTSQYDMQIRMLTTKNVCSNLWSYNIRNMVWWLVNSSSMQTKQKFIFFWKSKHNFSPHVFFWRLSIRTCFLSKKHLGLLFPDDLKWSMYIDNIVNHDYKKLGLMKKLKFTLCRNKLSKMTTKVTFVRLLLENASVLWDGCSISDTYKLQKVQLYAAKIVTGLPILASNGSLYFETGCERLCKRRKKKPNWKQCTNCKTQYLNTYVILLPILKKCTI